MIKTVMTMCVVLCALMMHAQTTLKQVYDETINPMVQIDQAVAKAKASGKFVICQVGGNWCPWCLRFADFISKDDTIKKVIDDNFVYIHVNYNPRKSGGDEQARQAAMLMRRLSNPGRFGYPVFVVLDEEGRVVHIQDSSFLEEGQGYSREKVLRFFKNWTPKATGPRQFMPTGQQAFGQRPSAVQQTADNQPMRQLKVGDVVMSISPSQGGKILSLKYKDQEMISQSTFPEAFGSTFWTSPQKEWNWPPVREFDKQPYTVEEKGGKLVLTSEVSSRLKYRIRKTFSTDAKDGAFVVTYTIINESGEVRRVAPWEITRVMNEGGLIFFQAPLKTITPANLMAFEEKFGAVWYRTDEANENRKINADGKGWLAYANKGLLLVKTFDDLQPSQPAPDEAEIQVYVNRGKSHIELESQGAYTTLQPNGEVSWTVRWYLLPIEGDIQPSKALLKKAQSVKR